MEQAAKKIGENGIVTVRLNVSLGDLNCVVIRSNGWTSKQMKFIEYHRMQKMTYHCLIDVMRSLPIVFIYYTHARESKNRSINILCELVNTQTVWNVLKSDKFK